ncbi:MAG TPA: ribonuclease III [Alphaproteobacteria bacterium]|nr:ribonuclease III [Alphaproteobacteria bacterium]
MNDSLEKKLGYVFKDPSLLGQALTHASTLKKGSINAFERLEFLGDRVLGLVIAMELYKKFPKEKEGELAKKLAFLVCKDTLFKVSDSLGLKKYLSVKEKDLTPQSSVLSDAVEGVLGAIFLDSCFDEAQKVILKHWKTYIAESSNLVQDPKSALQEYIQKKTAGKIMPVYTLIEVTGLAHLPEFHVRVTVEGIGEAFSVSSTKRQAEVLAAQVLLDKMKEKKLKF